MPGPTAVFRIMQMNPLIVSEFVGAMGEERLLEEIELSLRDRRAASSSAHQRLLEYLRFYLLSLLQKYFSTYHNVALRVSEKDPKKRLIH